MDDKFNNLPSGLNPVSRKQPLVAQYEIQYAAPITTDAMVQSITDLINFPQKYNYQHKRVWVKDKRAIYYLANGDGSDPRNWLRERSRTVIDKWDQSKDYEQDDCIYWSKKIYKAKVDVTHGLTNPADPASDDLWECICGDTETLRLLFGLRTPATNIVFNTEIVNPYFQIMIGDFELDAEGNPLLDPVTNLVIIKNPKYVDAHVIRRADLDDETGHGYEIQFESDCQPYGLSGAINVK